MARVRSIKNKNSSLPDAFTLKTDERIQLLANLIVDRIMVDQKTKETSEAASV